MLISTSTVHYLMMGSAPLLNTVDCSACSVNVKGGKILPFDFSKICQSTDIVFPSIFIVLLMIKFLRKEKYILLSPSSDSILFPNK